MHTISPCGLFWHITLPRSLVVLPQSKDEGFARFPGSYINYGQVHLRLPIVLLRMAKPSPFAEGEATRSSNLT